MSKRKETTPKASDVSGLIKETLEYYAKLQFQDFNPCMPGECEWRDMGGLAREALESLNRESLPHTSAIEGRFGKYKQALALALYYVESEGVYYDISARIDEMLKDEPSWTPLDLGTVADTSPSNLQTEGAPRETTPDASTMSELETLAWQNRLAELRRIDLPAIFSNTKYGLEELEFRLGYRAGKAESLPLIAFDVDDVKAEAFDRYMYTFTPIPDEAKVLFGARTDAFLKGAQYWHKRMTAHLEVTLTTEIESENPVTILGLDQLGVERLIENYQKDLERIAELERELDVMNKGLLKQIDERANLMVEHNAIKAQLERLKSKQK